MFQKVLLGWTFGWRASHNPFFASFDLTYMNGYF